MKLLAKFVLILFPVWAQAQFTIDGVMDEPQWMTIANVNSSPTFTSNTGFGTGNVLGFLKYYSDANNLYLGISGTVDANNDIILFIDDESYNGRGAAKIGYNMTGGWFINTTAFRSGSGSCGNPPDPNGVSGSIMDNDFDADYAFAFNKANTINEFYLDAVRFSNHMNDATDPAYKEGPFNVGMTDQSGTPGNYSFALPNWSTGAAQISFAYQNGFDITDGVLRNRGVEIKLPFAALPGIAAPHRARFFVIITSHEGFASNVCIPGDPGASNLGCSFNLSSIINPGYDIFYTQPWVILPLSFLSNTAKWNNGQALLQWTVAQDFEALQYTIERSANGTTFTTIGTVAAQQAKDFASYSFTDNNPLRGKNFYRIKAIRRNGEPKYSQQATLENTGGSFCIYPNPASGEVTLYGPNLQKGVYPVLISNITGQVVYRSAVYHSSGSLRTTLSLPSLPAGIYSLQLGNDRQLPAQRLVIE